VAASAARGGGSLGVVGASSTMEARDWGGVSPVRTGLPAPGAARGAPVCMSWGGRCCTVAYSSLTCQRGMGEHRGWQAEGRCRAEQAGRSVRCRALQAQGKPPAFAAQKHSPRPWAQGRAPGKPCLQLTVSSGSLNARKAHCARVFRQASGSWSEGEV